MCYQSISKSHHSNIAEKALIILTLFVPSCPNIQFSQVTPGERGTPLYGLFR